MIIRSHVVGCLIAAVLGAGCAPRSAVVQAPVTPGPPVTPPAAPPPLAELPAMQIEAQPTPSAPRQLYSLKMENQSVRDVLLALGETTDLSFSIGPGVEGEVTANLKEVTLEEMLGAMLTPLGLVYERRGNFIEVSQPRVTTRIFSVNYIATQRSGSAGLSASAGASSGGGGGVGGTTGTTSAGTGSTGGGGGGGGSSSSVGSSDTFDFWGGLQQQLQQFMSEEGKLLLSPTAGLVAVTDFPANIEQVARYLELVQGSVHRQVMIEARIIEVSLNKQFSAGIDWSLIPYHLALPGVGAITGALPGGAAAQQTGIAGSGIFQLGVTTQTGLRALVSALSTQGEVSIISSPKVSTLNNQKAVIKVGTDDVFFTQTTEREPLTGVVTQRTTPNTITEGLVLDVTPQIGEDAITMNIRPSISERLGSATSPNGDVVPILGVRATDTVVRVRDGETVVIGGLMSQRSTKNRNGVPGLQNAPVVGRAFRRDEELTSKVELVIVLTPTVISGRTDAQLTARELQLLREAGTVRR